MNKPLVLIIHGHEDVRAQMAARLQDDFEVYFADDFEHSKKVISEKFAAVLCASTPDDTSLGHAMEWIKDKHSSCIRVSLSTTESLTETMELVKSKVLHKHIPEEVTALSLKLHMQEVLQLSETLKERNRFQELSITDPVTELTNHRFFQEKLRLELFRAKRNKKPLSLVMIDVDHFKLLNDQFGHPKGDEVLALIAETLQSQSPALATISRYGGEEFAMVLPGTTSQQAFALAELTRKAVLGLDSFEFRTSISLGISSYPEHGLDADELIAVADQALYRAKRQGRNMSIVGSDI